jgi:hypothetical protein
MTNSDDTRLPSDPLDELTAQLLACGGVLSQIISHMVACAASGQSAPDAAPIPDVAHKLIRDVIDELAKRYSRRDIKVTAKIVAQATELIADNIFFVPLDSD